MRIERKRIKKQKESFLWQDAAKKILFLFENAEARRSIAHVHHGMRIVMHAKNRIRFAIDCKLSGF